MSLSKVSVLEIFPNNDDGQDDPPFNVFLSDPRIVDGSLMWRMDEDTTKSYRILSEEDGLYQFDGGFSGRIRELDPYDGVNLSPAGVAQPVEVLRAEVLRGGGVVAQEVSAVVAPDNTVVTLLLETALGVYVRYSGDWQLLSADSEALDDMGIITVSPEAVDVFDRADMASATLSAFDLPRVERFENGAEIKVIPEPAGRVAATEELGDTLVASGTVIPQINTVDDLDLAIAVAEAHPESRWYVAKRAKALDAMERVPEAWSPRAVVRPF